MRTRSDTIQREGQNIYSSRFGTSVTSSGLAEFQFNRLWNVFSVTNPKPWISSRIGPHTYRKISVMNGAFTEVKQGIYTLMPYKSVNTRYGRYDNAHPVYYQQPVIDYSVSATSDRALSKLLDKVRGVHADLAVDFAERRQTLQMLRSTANLKNLVKKFANDVVKQRGYRKIRKGPSQGQRRLDYVNGKWLEYRYGWMPLVSSIYTIGETWKKKAEKPSYVKARASDLKELKSVTGSGTANDPELTFTVIGGYRTEYGAFFGLPSGFSFSDWTSLNPLSIGWELLPFSFIADWVVNVGQCLENWENWFMYRNYFEVGYVSRSYREFRTLSAVGYSNYYMTYAYSPYGGWYPPNQMNYHAVSQTVAASYTDFARGVLVSLPTPSGPRLKVDLNAKRMLDSAALIGQWARKFR